MWVVIEKMEVQMRLMKFWMEVKKVKMKAVKKIED